jgi:N-acetylglutamate synthase-like GNAT family acetyltransferase
MITLRNATAGDLPELVRMLAAADMDYADPPEDYLIAVEQETIAGCARLEDHGDFMVLSPVLVAEGFRGRGVGRLMVRRILPAGRLVTLVSRGSAIVFYESMGFARTDWARVSAAQARDCDLCADREECMPQPMIRPAESSDRQ